MMDKNTIPGADHPDIRAVNDRALYGPKDLKVAELVRELTLTHSLRLAEVEALISAVLSVRKATLEVGVVKGAEPEDLFWLSNDVPMQFSTLFEAYQSGSTSEVDAAVNAVAEAHPMKLNGIADMVAANGDDETQE